MSEIVGVTYPIPKKFISRFFIDAKSVFIKPAQCFQLLKPGMKFVFYQSHEDTGFVGEGKITNISFTDDPLELIDRFDDRLFLTRDEIKTYINNQKRWEGIRVRKGQIKKKKWMAIELQDIKKYNQIKKPTRFVTVGGRYLKE